MSFYLSYTHNIKSRKSPHIFYTKDNVLCILSNKSEIELSKLYIKNENPVTFILHYIKSNNIYDSEILLPPLDDKSLDEVCELISNYLHENDDSIGILTDNPNFRKDYFWLLNKYGITYSIPREKPAHGAPNVARKVKTRRKPEFAEADASCFKTHAPRRPEPEDILESGLLVDEPFNTKFIKLLNESGKSNVEVYTRGGITRQVFSNIFSKKDFIPKKDTVICLIIGMELNYIDGINLLACAGYALSKSIVFDVVIMKYLKKGIYDLDIINDELDERGCSLLGWKPRDN